MALHAYIPQDRQRALKAGQPLPQHCAGSALFADIAGFTALTEALALSQGQRRGVDELSRRINAVHQALVDAAEALGGSVVGLAGDGLMAWFDGSDAPWQAPAPKRAAAAALRMQRAMAAFQGLSIKAGVASGSALRLAVGDPAIQLIDLLAGATAVRAVLGEGLAQAGEVLIDRATALALGQLDGPARRRAEAKGETGEEGKSATQDDDAEAFFVLDAAAFGPEPTATAGEPALNAVPLDPERLRPWVSSAVFARESAGGGLFATDLRPATALFVRWPLPPQPDAAELAERVAAAQRCVHHHGGVLLEVTVDAVGCCLYANVGAVRAHEDDARRALHAALELRADAAERQQTIQLGASSGTLCVGGYGAESRRSFGAIGDAVNEAARLMARAAPGEVLVSGRVHQAAAAVFSFEPRPPVPVKGKAEPMAVFALAGLKRQRAIRLQEPAAVLPLVGRDHEVALLSQKLAQARTGGRHWLRLVAEAGMGKSRLLAEGVRLALRQGFVGYGGSSGGGVVGGAGAGAGAGAGGGGGASTPYRLWHGVWTAFFDIDPALPQRRQRQTAQAGLALFAPEHAAAWPLLGAALGQDWPDNEFTATLAPKDRNALLHTLLLRCLQAATEEAAADGAGVVLVLEDLHAADALSLQWLELLVRALPATPLLLLTSERPGAGLGIDTAAAETIELTGLATADVEHIVRAKLAAWYPEGGGSVPPALIERIATRAQGNPFYVEELLDHLHARGLDPRSANAVAALDWPSSLHSLVLSRLDRLAPAQQHELKAASVIGRVFAVTELQGYCPSLGTHEAVSDDLQELARQGFTPRQAEAAVPSHVFKHLVTQEVSYDSIAADARRRLHAQYARYVEGRAEAGENPAAARLAFHFERAAEAAPAAHWLRRAGEQAAAAYANDEALALFGSALRWLPADAIGERFAIGLAREAIFHLQSRHDAQRDELAELQRLVAAGPAEPARDAALALRRARLHIATGDHATALAEARAVPTTAAPEQQIEALLLESRALIASGQAAAAAAPLAVAREQARAAQLAHSEVAALSLTGLLHWQLSAYAEAQGWLDQALAASGAVGDLRQQLDILNNLGMVAKARSRFAQSATHYAAAQAIAQRIGDRYGEAMLLNNQGSTLLAAGDYAEAGRICALAAERFAASREPAEHGIALLNCAEAHREMGQLDAALALSQQALALLRASGFKRGEAAVLENIGLAEHAQGRWAEAAQSLHAALALARLAGARALEASTLHHLGMVQTAAGELAAARVSLDAAASLSATLGADSAALAIDAALATWAIAAGDRAQALGHLQRLLPALLREPRRIAPGESMQTEPPALPMSVFAAAWSALVACADARAGHVREAALSELNTRAARIADSAARRDFMAIAAHRALVAG